MQRLKKCPQCGAKCRDKLVIPLTRGCINESPNYHYFMCRSVEFDDGRYAFSEDCNTAYMDKLVVIVNDLRKENKQLRKENKKLKAEIQELNETTFIKI